MRIIQISDLHLATAPGQLYEGIDTLGRCSRLLDRLKKEPADLLVATGDIAAESENAFSYEFLRENLNDFPYPWVVLPGNHDRGFLFKEIFGAHAKIDFEAHTPQGETDILFFDNSGEEPNHLEALKDYLAHSRKTACLFTHYPPVPVRHPSYDGKHRLSWQKQLFDVLQKTPSPLYVFFGHIHFEFEQKINGISFHSVPSATIPIIPGDDRDAPDTRGLYYRNISLALGQFTTSVCVL